MKKKKKENVAYIIGEKKQSKETVHEKAQMFTWQRL